jgi:DNA repair protein RAD50
MTTINKLLIQGVRSYSPDEPMSIEFFKPLTLIVGQNGCGKTTIIECLRHITTGELPPNCDHGKSFVHDTRVLMRNTVHSKVMLKFKNVIGAEFTASSLFCLKQEALAQKFQSTDFTVGVKSKDGKEGEMNQPHANMSKMVPDLMGVSKAVLSHVIFCHQEQSNWPLSESKELKERFDEIFAATKYSTALEQIKKLVKESAAKVREYQLALAELGGKKEALQRLRNMVEDANAERATQMQKRGEIQEAIQQLQLQKGNQNASVLKIQKIQNQIETHSEKVVFYRTELEKFQRQEITILPDSDEDLLSIKIRLEAEKNIHGNTHADDIRNRSQIELSIGNLRKAKSDHDLQISLGESQKRSVMSAIESRDSLCLLLANEYNVAYAGSGGLCTAECPFLADLQSKIELLNSDDDRKISAVRAEVQSVSQLCGSIHQKIESLHSQVATLESQRASKQHTIDEKTMKLHDNRNFQAKELAAQAEERAAFERLNEKRSSGVIAHLKKDLGTKEAQQSELRTKLEALESQLQECHRVEQLASRSRVLSDEAKRNLDSCKLEWNALTPKVASALNVDVSIDGLETISQFCQLLQSKQECLETELKAFESDLSYKKSQIATYAEKKRSATEDLRSCEAELTEMESELQRIPIVHDLSLTSDGLSEQIALSEREILTLQSRCALVATAKTHNAQFLSHMQARHECPICEQTVTDKHIDVYEQRLNPVNLSRKEDEIQQKIEQQRLLVQSAKEALRLVTSIARKKENQCEISSRISIAVSSMEVIERAILDVGSRAQGLKQNLKEAGEIIAKCEELHRSFKQASEILRQCNQDCVLLQERGSSSSIQGELVTARSLRQKVESDVSVCSQKLSDEIRELAALDMRHKDAALHYERCKAESMQYTSIQADVDALRAEISSIMMSDLSLKQQLESCSSEATRLSERERRAKSELILQEPVFRDARDKRNSKLGELKIKQNEIMSMPSLSSIDSNIRSRAQMSVECGQRLKLSEQELKALTDKIQQQEGKESQIAKVLWNIETNISLRKIERDLQSEKDAIEQKKLELAPLKSSGVQEAFRQTCQLVDDRMAYFNKLSGVIESIDSQRANLQQQIDGDSFNGVDKLHSIKLVEHRTEEMAHGDLIKYHAALDQALMRFHQMKMDEVNKLISEYWQQTYRGRDIDTIKIVSDVESEKLTRRSYNYRVVMRKNDVEIDMRGRCSSGQKVLACLVIRLALAESFCTSCGILALDEPTTNLDHDNIMSLAQALGRIIEARRGNSHFQLIIIR